MTKKEATQILSKASLTDVREIARAVKGNSEIQIVKQPQKTLVMVKVREPVKQSLFYLGEVLASECMVMVDGVRGVSVIAGDDFDKVYECAVIDGCMNKNTDNEVLENMLLKLKSEQEMERASLNREIRKSKVNFQVMGE